MYSRASPPLGVCESPGRHDRRRGGFFRPARLRLAWWWLLFLASWFLFSQLGRVKALISSPGCRFLLFRVHPTTPLPVAYASSLQSVPHSTRWDVVFVPQARVAPGDASCPSRRQAGSSVHSGALVTLPLCQTVSGRSRRLISGGVFWRTINWRTATLSRTAARHPCHAR